MDALPPSNTPTLRGTDDAYDPNPSPPHSPVVLSRPHRARSHDPNQPDMSFPFQTTNVAEGGFTDEYRVTSATGYVAADSNALRPIPSHVSETPAALRDPEKAAQLEKVKLVTWLDNDPEDPRNWSDLYKWYLTGVCALGVVTTAFSSAVITGDFKDIMSEFHIGVVVVSLSVSLMVVGFGVGPLVWAPMSELYGRKWVWLIPSIINVIFNIPCALAPNVQTLMICRFICGFFSSSPFALAGGTIADIWDNEERGFAIALFAAAPYGGPILGPIIGGFVGDALGWRWTMWINMIFAGAVCVPIAFIPETFAPVLLKRRAAKLRIETGDPNIVTEQELFKQPLGELLKEAFIRPFEMLFTEPILLLLSLYISLIYGLLYAYFFSYPIVFSEGYHWNDGQVGLAFCSVWIGLFAALFVTPQLEKNYHKCIKAKGKADPEDRLPGMMMGAPFIPISLFIFGWTAPPAVMPHGGSWVGPASSGLLFGFGMVTIYFSANAYIIDTFPGYVASALAAKTVLRSGSGAAMPLFITAMYHNIGTGWAASTWAFISIAMIPIPFLFYRYGKRIRAMSKRAAAA
ncbi:MFS general substrate transporter [Abortiporus biennis]|nr:MFS general substrate transporter [Abortiporus biennis]